MKDPIIFVVILASLIGGIVAQIVSQGLVDMATMFPS